MLLESVKTLLGGVLDYAGLFPPAGLAMPAAVANYRRYAAGPERWMLGRFVLPVSRLAEFQTLLLADPPPSPWKLSALTGADLAGAIPAVLAFNAHVRDAQIDSLEARAASPDHIREQAAAAPPGFTVYWEIPAVDPASWLEAIAHAGQRAKIRTGGLDENQFPSLQQVATFIRTCDQAKVPFKATAGLHHAIRGPHPLTYEPNANSCVMHGFLNVFLAAAFQWAAIGEQETSALLSAAAADFRFSRRGAAWDGRWIANAQIQSARQRLAAGFGSCSFDEPVAELQAMRLL